MGPGGWSDHMSNGTWWWIPMMLVWVVIVGGLVWIGVAALRRLGNVQHPYFSAGAAPPPPEIARQTPEEILAERLARGEIEPDDYRTRLEALRSSG
jgi:putative membrane protein